MRQRRTIYHNDARHDYLWLFEPPMDMQDAWIPIDELAGTAVDTFSYCVSRTDGVFYNTSVDMLLGSNKSPHEYHIEWRAYECMMSLIRQGLDPMKVLIDRAHEKGMDFITDLRLGTYPKISPGVSEKEGGMGFLHPELRGHQFNVLKELAYEYDIQGVELDFSCPPHGSPYLFKAEDADQGRPALTEWLRRVADMVHNRPGGPGMVGARIYPTEQGNWARGYDVPTWIREGLVDFVVPVMYAYDALDPNMPFDWVVNMAHKSDVSVYGFLQHNARSEQAGAKMRQHPTPEMFRAAAANYWDKGVDGLYTWMLDWPLGEVERGILSEMGDPDLVVDRKKHYVMARKTELATSLGYAHPIPITMEVAPDTFHKLPFYIADDMEGAENRISQVILRLYWNTSVSADRFTICLNGESLEDETCLRVRKPKGYDTYPHSNPRNFWMEFHLRDVRPRHGENVLEISFDGRPENLVGKVTMEEFEVIIEYSAYWSGM